MSNKNKLRFDIELTDNGEYRLIASWIKLVITRRTMIQLLEDSPALDKVANKVVFFTCYIPKRRLDELLP
jgi:hypothetical protein